MPNPFFVPVRTPAAQKLESVMKRDLKDRADEVLSRPNARFSNGMWNPRVVSTEDVKVVAQVYPKVPEQQGRPREALQPLKAVGRGLELANRPFQVAGAITGAVGPALVAPQSPLVASLLASRQRGGEVAEVGKQAVTGRISPRGALGELVEIQERKPLLQQFTSELPASLIPPVGGTKAAVKGFQAAGKTALRGAESALIRAPALKRALAEQRGFLRLGKVPDDDIDGLLASLDPASRRPDEIIESLATGEPITRKEQLLKDITEMEAMVDAMAQAEIVRPRWATGLTNDQLMNIAKQEGRNPYTTDWGDALDTVVIREAKAGGYKSSAGASSITNLRSELAAMKRELRALQAPETPVRIPRAEAVGGERQATMGAGFETNRTLEMPMGAGAARREPLVSRESLTAAQARREATAKGQQELIPPPTKPVAPKRQTFDQFKGERNLQGPLDQIGGPLSQPGLSASDSRSLTKSLQRDWEKYKAGVREFQSKIDAGEIIDPTGEFRPTLPVDPNIGEIARLEHQASELEGLASRGMKPKVHTAQAAKLRLQAEELKQVAKPIAPVAKPVPPARGPVVPSRKAEAAGGVVRKEAVEDIATSPPPALISQDELAANYARESARLAEQARIERLTKEATVKPLQPPPVLSRQEALTIAKMTDDELAAYNVARSARAVEQAAPAPVDEATRRRQLIERLQAEDRAAGLDAESFVRTADPSGGGRPPRRPGARAGAGGEQPPTPSEPDDIFRQVTAQATKKEKIDQTLLRRHAAAITTAENEARVVVDQGNERLRALDIGGIRQGRLVPRETDIPVLDDLFDALHNPSKVASGEMRVPTGFENEYNRLRQLTDWEESMRIDFDPEMATVDDYFYRGWIVPKEGVPRPPGGIARGRLGTTPSFKKPRVDATYREMRDAGFEPLSFNPYEQWRISRLQGVRYRQQMQLIDHLKRLDLAVTDASGVATEGWRTPKVGPAFEGKIFATTDAAGEPIAMYSRRYVVPDDLAGRLESMYGVMPDLGNVHVGNRSFSLIKAIDAVVFIPKRAKLFASAFQQVDFLNRSYIGGWSGMVDSLLAGKPIEAVKNLAVIPRTTARVIEANFRPGARAAIRQQLDSTTPLIAGRPGIHLRGIMEAGLSTIDTTLLPANLDRTARVIAEEAGLLGNKAVRRALASLESSMRRGLFEGTYPAAQIETIKTSIAPRIVRLYGKGMSDEALSGMIAQATNKMFSTIPASQTVIQNRALREILRRVFFSIGESEGLLRQAFGTIPITLKGTAPFVGLRRQESLFWAEHWLGAYLGLIALANAVHFASTGEPLPRDRWSPVSKDKWGPLPIGYNRQFASPNLPFRGSDGEQLMLDIVGQMDTAFRILDPISFLSSRESVPIRAFVTQTTERDFFGRPIDRVGPGGIYSRTANLINDMFTPIGPGQAALQIGLQRGNIPEGLIPSSEGRIGQTGQLVQATGLNVRAQPAALTPVRKRRKPIRIPKKRELVGAR